MWSSHFLITSSLWFGFGIGFDFNGPLATPISGGLDTDGWTPRPTSHPEPFPELFRRVNDPALCGYFEGNISNPARCSAGSCALTSLHSTGYAGCCTGAALTDCDMVTKCVEASTMSLGSSEIACFGSSPFCVDVVTTSAGYVYRAMTCGTAHTTQHMFVPPVKATGSLKPTAGAVMKAEAALGVVGLAGVLAVFM